MNDFFAVIIPLILIFSILGIGWGANDIEKALQSQTDFNIHRSMLILVQLVLENLEIDTVEYHHSPAGNTTGVIVKNVIHQGSND